MTIPHMYRTRSGSVIRRLACATNDNAAASAAIGCTDDQRHGQLRGQPRAAVNGHLPASGTHPSRSVGAFMRAGGLSDRILAADGHDAACRANIRTGVFVPCRCDVRAADDPARVVGIAIAFGQLSCPRGLALPKVVQHRLSRLADAGDGAALAVRDWLARNEYLASADMAASVPERDNGGRSATNCTALTKTTAARPRSRAQSHVDRSRLEPSRMELSLMDRPRPTISPMSTLRISPLRKTGDA